MRETRGILEQYLTRIGLSRPSDAAQQLQVTLLQQWTDHLDYVLETEGVPPETALRIIRGMLYGGVPVLAEAELRQHMTQDLIRAREDGWMT